MKLRHKITALVSTAAALVIVAAVAALAANGLELGKPRQDLVLGQDLALGQQLTSMPTAMPVARPLNTVYYTEKGNYFHTDPDCSGMTGAQMHNPSEAFAAGKDACPLCVAHDAIIHVYSAEGDPCYHAENICADAEKPRLLTGYEAYYLGLQPCPACLEAPVYPTPEPTVPEEEQRQEHWLDGMLQVYASQNGKFYHAVPDCSGMENADLQLSYQCTEQGQEACPVCIPDPRDSSFRRFFGTGITEAFPGFTRTVANLGNYSDRHGAYLKYFAHMRLENADGDFIVIQLTPPAYGLDGELELSAVGSFDLQSLLDHSYEPFGDLTNELIPLYMQKRTGIAKSCPVSAISVSFDGDEAVTGCSTVLDIDEESSYLVHWPMMDGRFILPEIEPTPMPEEKVFASEHGVYYHSDSSCAGLKGAVEILRREAVRMGKQSCPLCMENSAQSTPAPLVQEDERMFSTPIPIRSTPDPTLPVTATLTPRPTPTPMPAAQDEARSSYSFGVIGGADGPTSIFITHPTAEPTPMPADSAVPGENPTFTPLRAAFSRILGVDFVETFPGYILDYAEGHPTEVGSGNAAYNMWQFTSGDQTLVVSLLEAGEARDGVLSINFPDSTASFRVMKQAAEPLRSLYMKIAPALVDGLTALTGGESIQGRYLWDAFIHFNARSEITNVELVYAMADASTAHLSWNTAEGEPRLYNISWIG